jgi:hypothetical protein
VASESTRGVVGRCSPTRGREPLSWPDVRYRTLRVGSKNDIEGHYNIVALKIAADVELAWLPRDQFAKVVTSILSRGEMPVGSNGFQVSVPRRDVYRVDENERYPPPRLRRYLETHPAARLRYETKNVRTVRPCTWCFS